jgi:hypothetical protein
MQIPQTIKLKQVKTKNTMSKNKTNLVFNRMFNFLGLKPTSMHTLFRSYQFSQKKFGQLNHLYKLRRKTLWKHV